MKRTLSLFLAVLILSVCLLGCNATAQLKKQLNARITRGAIEGNTYKSDFTDITFTKPDHWRYYTDEEIAETININIEAMDANAFERTTLEYASVYDMIVVNESTGQNVCIGYENLSLTIGKSVSEEEYYDYVKDQLVKEGYVNTGNKEYVTLSGEKYLKATFTGTTKGYEAESNSYFRLIGDIMAFITVTTPTGLIDRNIEGMFS